MISYGLLDNANWEYSHADSLDDFIQWGESLSVEYFVMYELDQASLLKRCVEIMSKSTLTLADFEHIAFMRETMNHYLQQALQQRQKGEIL